MYKFDIAELSRNDYHQWDTLVDYSRHGTIFHKTGWLDACARALGKKVKIFGCFQDGQLIGGCSLFLEKIYGILTVANSTCCIMTPYGGVVLSASPSTSVHRQETYSREIIESLIKEFEKEQFYSISIQNSPQFLDIRPFTLNGWRSSVFYAYYINLDNYFESNYDSSAKRNIRKAEKNRIIFEPFSDISRYYTLFCETYTRKNLEPPVPERLFTDIYSFIRDQNCGKMVVAKTTDDEIACAEIVIWDSKQAFSLSAVSDSRFLNSGASSFLMNEELKMLRNQGIPMINIMMANVPQLSSFASSFNPSLLPYYQVQSRKARHLLNFEI